jgi:tRNA G18 (ribose-2'-O)-methylase SpoU
VKAGVRVEPVDALDDARLAEYRALPAGVPPGCFVAEGQVVVRRLLEGGRFRVRSVLATAAALDALRPSLDAAPAPPPVAYVAPRATVAGVVGFAFHRGCLALGERRPVPDVPSLLSVASRLVVALDAVSGPDNVGAIVRNACAFGAGAVLLGPGCADPLHRRAIRASAGGTLVVPWAAAADWPAALAALRAAGLRLVALTPDAAARDVAEMPCPPRAALLVGAEGRGLGAASRDAADVSVRIAMAEGMDSLNVAAATAIVLHRWLRPDA